MPKYIIEWRNVYDDDAEFGLVTGEPVEASTPRRAIVAHRVSLCTGEEYRVREVIGDKKELVLKGGVIRFEDIALLGPATIFRTGPPRLHDVTAEMNGAEA